MAIVPRDSDSDDAFASDSKVSKSKRKNRLKLNASRNSQVQTQVLPDSKASSEELVLTKLKERPANSHEFLEEIDLSVAEPDLSAHGISSQETIIMSSCESLTNSTVKNESLLVKGNSNTRHLQNSLANEVKELPVKKSDVNQDKTEVSDVKKDEKLVPDADKDKSKVPGFDSITINRINLKKEVFKRRTEDNTTKLDAKRLKFDKDESLEEKCKVSVMTVLPEESTKLLKTSAINPGKVKSSSMASSHLSPSPGLRLGLSRNRRTSKPLHPTVKPKDYQF